ncbi:MAG: hypothetical protein IJD01_05925 [Clostridia bacterium]|nr:hypothetical protein [Clostridia bacterium]
MEEWTVGLCAAGIGCAVLEQLVPDGAVKRVFSVLVAVAFFGCFLSPLSSLFRLAGGWLVQATPVTDVPTALNDTVTEQITEVLEEAMRQDAEARLGVTVREVRIYRDITRDDSIYIERADVVFDGKEHPLAQGAVQQLEQVWGTALEVYYAD